jgi:hypothetical protein
MPLFRKLPMTVEAHRWFRNGDHPEDGPPDQEGKVVRYWRRPDTPGPTSCPQCGAAMHDHGWIDTLEDGHRVRPGDWIVTGSFNERYPVKHAIFVNTFDEVG